MADSSTTIPEQCDSHKSSGTRHFSSGDYESAVDSYQSALVLLQPMNDYLVWPEHERFALALHANLALCFLNLNRPAEAVEHCSKARALPVFQVNASEDIRQKIYVRHIQALLDCRDQPGTKPQSKSTSTSTLTTDQEIWAMLDDARLRGYLRKSKNVTLAVRKKFLGLGARLHKGNKSLGCSTAEEGLVSWTDHLVRAGVIDVTSASATRKRVRALEGSDNEKERQIIAELDALIPKPTTTMKELCKKVIAYITFGALPALATADMKETLLKSHLHPCAVDEDGQGHLMWAIGTAIFECDYRNTKCMDTFLALLFVLVDELGVSIDQRGTTLDQHSRNPLQTVAKFGNPRSVREMLDRGAKVNLRDDEGWTALASICMDQAKVTEDRHRVAAGLMLIGEGSDVNAESTTGMTPLLLLCSKPCTKLFQKLLDSGADKEHIAAWGQTATNALSNLEESPANEECQRLLGSPSNPVSILQAKLVRFRSMLRLVEKVKEDFFKSLSSVEPLGPKARRQRAELDLTILSALFDHLGLDSKKLSRPFQPGDSNWVKDFHSKMHELVPDEYLQVYVDKDPSKDSILAMLPNDNSAFNAGVGKDEHNVRRFSMSEATRRLFAPYRERGVVFDGLLSQFHDILVKIQYRASFAVPTDMLLEKIGERGPVVEVGAGTGYWTALLKARDIDVIAYDVHPPTADHEDNIYFNYTYTDVLQGDATSMFESQSESELSSSFELSDRTLLMIWPDNPDEKDNPHLTAKQGVYSPVWDADCLESYIRAGGSTVVYVGEREENIRVLPDCRPDCGISASRRFQELLKTHFHLVEEIKIPQWYLCSDDATIWKRKEPDEMTTVMSNTPLEQAASADTSSGNDLIQQDRSWWTQWKLSVIVVAVLAIGLRALVLYNGQ
jgi:hypothetical protein